MAVEGERRDRAGTCADAKVGEAPGVGPARSGFFAFMAPLFGRFGDRWSPRDVDEMAGRIEPFLSERRTLLDLGGGTGALASRLADRLAARVTVLDASPDMMRYLPCDDRVTGVHGVAEAMPFDDGDFDVVIVSDAFHHFRDQDAAVAEIERVTRCGGGLYVMEFERTGFMRVIVWGERALGEPARFFSREELCAYLSERGIHGDCVASSWFSYYFLGEVCGEGPPRGDGPSPRARMSAGV